MFIKNCWPAIEISDIYSKELEEKKFRSFIALCFKLKGTADVQHVNIRSQVIKTCIWYNQFKVDAVKSKV